MTRFLLQVFLVALSSLYGVRAETEKCDLDCNNRGTCKFGNKNHETLRGKLAIDILPWAEQNSIDGMYCNCDAGFTGVTCEIEHEICSGDSDDRCFNGGTCLRMYVADSGKWENRCDCTTATKIDGNELTRYAGEFCQYKETAACSHELFCTNGGECRDRGIARNSRCECPEGFHGPRCEYKGKAGDEIPCDLGCQNGGQCSIGIKSWEEIKVLSKDPIMPFMQEMRELGFMHCICPPGYTGVLCDIKYEQCGSKVCYFGSTCNEDKVCDCTSAYTNDTSYAGFNCEYPSTTRCPTANGQHPGDAFCTNNGICHDEGSHRGCYCPQGFSGPRCEHKGDVAKPCDLECENGGKCQHGVKFHEFGEIMSLNKKQSKLTKDGMYCACPFDGGYTGLQCEIPVESCYVDGRKEDHICLHGAKCRRDGKDDEGKPKFTCDCSTTTTVDDDGIKTPFAGKFCEYEPTDICLREGDAEYGLTDHFCTNDGRCKEIAQSSGESHRGCDCPDNFIGEHCEIAVKSLETAEPTSRGPGHSSSNHHSVAISLVLLVVVSILTIFGVLIRKQLVKRAQEKENQSSDQFTKDFEPSPSETEVDEDDEMENIEII